MDYIKQYNKLIERARNRKLESYTERHHIVPKSIGGEDTKENLVNLTAREHFIAHILLVKIYPKSYAMIKAVMMMTAGHTEHRSMNRVYGWLKTKHSEEMSRIQTGSSNSQYGKMWISNIEERISKRIQKDEEIPFGWIKGRNKWYILDKKEKKRNELFIKKVEFNNYFINLFETFKKGDFYSVNDFCNKIDIKYTSMTVKNNWKKLCPEYKAIEGKNFTSVDARKANQVKALD